MENVKIFDHPVIQHYLTIIRNQETPTQLFAESVTKIMSLMVYEITKELPTVEVAVRTPLKETVGKLLSKKIVIAPILRAGLGMVEGIRQVVPEAKVGHIGMYRDEVTLQPKEYFCKLPKDVSDATVYVVDPMLATGGSVLKAIEILQKAQAKDIRLVFLLGAPEGIKAVHDVYPEIPIYLAVLDEKLNESGYIVPGLGDAGDRIFGTE